MYPFLARLIPVMLVARSFVYIKECCKIWLCIRMATFSLHCLTFWLSVGLNRKLQIAEKNLFLFLKVVLFNTENKFTFTLLNISKQYD